MLALNRASFLNDDMLKIVDRLPTTDEYRRVRHLALQQLEADSSITDDDLAAVFAAAPHLETVVLSGFPATTDRTVILLAESAMNLHGLDLSGCLEVTDVSVFEIAKSLSLVSLQLNGLVGLTDPSITALVKSCSRLVELELTDLPLLSAISVRDIFFYSRKLRTLRLARCPLLTDKAFPAVAVSRSSTPVLSDYEKPLPPRPTTWLDELPPLIIRHKADNLRILDLSFINGITDAAIEGIVSHAPKIQHLQLSGCKLLTDRALESICKLGHHLDVLMLAHVGEITDRGVVKLARACTNLRCVDVGFCRRLTDMSVFCLAELRGIRRLSLVRVHKMTDIALFALAEHALDLERLNLSYCDRLTLDAVHLLVKRLVRLQHLSATGIPSLKRKGVQRFSDTPPADYDADQQAAFYVFNGDGVSGLRKFLAKEELRRRSSEEKNIPFTERSDDGLDLY
ncbi:hypothetical protein FB45DRAFT_827665 [Roridomyces roridus]|uniref:F-box/LRR-repeat protein 15-like leucin rich repeat domain-containing protein n=1 Tax=Roridomyces roridus TaxID=1738132 RepID=A0AAD7C4W2_9AGAR|nr:hypothetical protein FB45DRAFT_827665 [Roridomyces roridus]